MPFLATVGRVKGSVHLNDKKKTVSSSGILSHWCGFICPGLKVPFLVPCHHPNTLRKKSTKTPAATFLAGGEDTCGRDLTDEYLELFLGRRDRAGIKKNWFSFPLTDCHHPRYGVNIKTVRSGCGERKGLSFLSSHRDVCVSCPLWCVVESNKRWQRRKGKYLVISSMPFTQLIPCLISSLASSRAHFIMSGETSQSETRVINTVIRRCSLCPSWKAKDFAILQR